MNKNIFYILIFIVLAGIGFYQYQRPTPSSIQQPISSPLSQSPSRYSPYTAELFEKINSPRRVLYFYANWCPTCRPANLDFEQNQDKIPSDVQVIRVNYNDPDTDQAEQELARKYGITYQHTFVQIDQAGREVTKWNGGATAELLTHLK